MREEFPINNSFYNSIYQALPSPVTSDRGTYGWGSTVSVIALVMDYWVVDVIYNHALLPCTMGSVGAAIPL